MFCNVIHWRNVFQIVGNTNVAEIWKQVEVDTEMRDP